MVLPAHPLPDGSARKLFDQALERPESERRAFLRQACGTDEVLRRQVDELLTAYVEAEAAYPEAASGEMPGDRIGPYKLLERIGEGGFGTVWMAEQEAPMRRRVALKILKWGMDTRRVVARFEAERQALALMDHAYIAHVLDGGATANGRPYFVMELVRGVPITRYCDEARLPLRERLELFQHVCAAVQHAHQKGIIHRDLKPGNVLVTLQDGRPVPKVIDFGIAKATSGQLTEKTLLTGMFHVLGTPEYMAPEQAEMSGIDVDTRADIYSLGVLLYELLTGTRPFELPRLVPLGFQELLRQIREALPEKPSSRVGSLGARRVEVCRRRRVHPRALRRLLDRDLDWIVLKALEKERAERYATADGLAADIEHYLSSEPVEAGPPSRLYRLRKHLRRHWVGASSAAAVVLAISGGSVLSWHGYREARAQEKLAKIETDRANDESRAALVAREQESRQRVAAERELAVRTQIFEFLHQLLTEFAPGESDMSVRQMIDRAAARLESGMSDDPRVEAEIHDMLAYQYWRMDEPVQAEAHARRHLAILERALGPDAEETLNAVNLLAMRTRDPGEREALFRRAAQGRLALLGAHHPSTLQSQGNVAAMHWEAGRLAEAEEAMVALLRVHEELGLHDRTWGMLTHNLARVRLDLGRPAEALETLDRALVFLDSEFEGDDPGRYPVMATLAEATLAIGDAAGAEAIYTEELARCRAGLGPAHDWTLGLVDRLTTLLEERGEVAQAAAEYERTVLAARARHGSQNPVLADVLHHWAADLADLGDIAAAETHAREAAEIYASATAPPPEELRHAAEVLARILEARGAPGAERAELLGPLLERQRRNVPPDHYDLIRPLSLVGDALCAAGLPEEAEPLVREAERIATLHWPPGTYLYEHFLELRMLLARILLEKGEPTEAEEVLADVHEHCGSTPVEAAIKARAASALEGLRGSSPGARTGSDRDVSSGVSPDAPER